MKLFYKQVQPIVLRLSSLPSLVWIAFLDNESQVVSDTGMTVNKEEKGSLPARSQEKKKEQLLKNLAYS